MRITMERAVDVKPVQKKHRSARTELPNESCHDEPPKFVFTGLWSVKPICIRRICVVVGF